jgi:RHS repeat-associated protein
VRHHLADALGSVTALADENGAVKTTYSYDPFGQVAAGGEASGNPFQFAGRENDGIGLLFERNRYYSPELRRYISEDPIGLVGGEVNYYVRVGNDPINLIDPLGLFSINDRISGAIEGIQHGWDSGYYKCLFKCLLIEGAPPPAFAKGIEEAIKEFLKHGGAEKIARKYFSKKYPKWFQAGGKYSKVLVPGLANKIMLGAKFISGVGWIYFIYEEYACAKKCMKCL